MIICAWRKPFICWAAYVLLVETRGVQQYVSNGTVVLLPYILAIIHTTIIAWRRSGDEGLPRFKYLIGFVAVATSWSFASGLYWEGSIQLALQSCVGLGIPALLFALAFYDDKASRGIFFAILTFQLIIAAIMSNLPGTPLALLTVKLHQASENGVASATSLYGQSEAPLRAAAQFGHPIEYGVWTAVGFVTGLYVVMNGRLWVRAMGFVLLGASVMGLITSEFRGGIAGIVLGIIFMLIRSHPAAKVRMVTISGLFAVIVLAFWDDIIDFAMTNQRISLVLERFQHAGGQSDTQYRFEAIARFQDFLLSTDSLLGYGGIDNIKSRLEYLPHQSFFAATEFFGLPVGIAALMITLFAATGVIFGDNDFDRENGTKGMAGLPILLAFTVIVVMFTNHNAGASLLYLSAGLACLPWAYRRIEDTQPFDTWEMNHPGPALTQ